MNLEEVKVLVVTGNRIISRKFYSKVAPLIELEQVSKIYVVTKSIVSGCKIKGFSPKGPFRKNLLFTECYKLSAIIYILLKYTPDIIIALGLIPQGIYANILGVIFRKKRVLLSMGKNELIYSNDNKLQRILLKIASLADAIGTRGSNSKKQLVERGFNPDKIFISHNVFDFDDFKSRECAKKYDLIYVGLIEHYKRIDQLINVVDKLVKEYDLKEIKLVIVGEGSLKKVLRHKSECLGLSNNIVFLPAGDISYLCNLYNQSRIFVMTSEGEGLPMAMIEAMSCGLPVVIFDDADIPDVVHHGENGLLIKPGDLDGFVKAINLLLHDNNLYENLSCGALAIRDKYKYPYSLEAMRTAWEKVLMECRQ